MTYRKKKNSDPGSHIALSLSLHTASILFQDSKIYSNWYQDRRKETEPQNWILGSIAYMFNGHIGNLITWCGTEVGY